MNWINILRRNIESVCPNTKMLNYENKILNNILDVILLR